MPNRETDTPFTGEPQPIPELDVSTIHETRRRLFGIILAREVEIRQVWEPSFTIENPETDAEKIEAAKELDEYRKSYRDEKMRRDGEFIAYWTISDLLDELENYALKQKL